MDAKSISLPWRNTKNVSTAESFPTTPWTKIELFKIQMPTSEKDHYDMNEEIKKEAS